MVVLTLALIAWKLSARSQRIAILVLILGILEAHIFIIGHFLVHNIGITHFQSLIEIFLYLAIASGILAGYGGIFTWAILRREKLAKEAKAKKA
nr:hypothetical protein [Candidatus Freyarchaeota archaeon]